MPRTNSWLCTYALGQLGRPYWYGTYGQISTTSLYNGTVRPSGYSYNDYKKQLGVKVHDCSGLVLGALMCSSINGKPSGSAPIAHGATSQFNGNCSKKSNSMSNFPYIPGTLVFTKNGSKKSHVGIYIGTYIDKNGSKHTNTVVEAMGHKWGVVTSQLSNKKWNAWGQLKCCTVNTTKGMIFTIGADPGAKSTTVSNNSNNTSVVIETKNMRPFVATIPQGTNPNIDYIKLKAARVSAMMFFGGELYDSGHKQKTYINPYLESQVSKCNDAGLFYALYVNVKARTVIEADAECRTLYYVISQFSPALGLWLSIQSDQSVEVNNAILEVYYKYINQWGLKARCGLYVTPTQLSKITWNSFKDRFYLWMIDDSVDVTSLGNKILQPSLFEVPD